MGAVILLDNPPAGVRPLAASDGRAAWLGELQQNAKMGPLHAAMRTGRPMLTADLTRIGPPALAAAAAESSSISALALSIDFEGERLGALQLLGGAWRPVEAVDGEALQPLLDVLAARLDDVRALDVASRPTQPKPSPVPRMPSPPNSQDVQDVANTCEVTTRSLPIVSPRTAMARPPRRPRPPDRSPRGSSHRRTCTVRDILPVRLSPRWDRSPRGSDTSARLRAYTLNSGRFAHERQMSALPSGSPVLINVDESGFQGD